MKSTIEEEKKINIQTGKVFLEIIKDVSLTTFMPLTVGGKINSIKDIEDRLLLGADKKLH